MERSTERLDQQCSRFEELLVAMRTRELTEDEWTFYLEHDESCQSEHSESKLEEALGVKPGALERGDVQKGLMSARELEEQTLQLIRLLRARDEDSSAVAHDQEWGRSDGENSSRWASRTWVNPVQCCIRAVPGLDHFRPHGSLWNTEANGGGSQCSAEKGLLLVIWDRMPDTQEIPALRRMLELSLAEFWMVLITYWYSSEAGPRVPSHRRLHDEWDVLFWRDSPHRLEWQTAGSNPRLKVLENLRQQWAHPCSFTRAFSWKRPVRIVAPMDGKASGWPSAGGERPTTWPGILKAVKDEEAQIVRLDELLDRSRRSFPHGETTR